VKSVAAAQSGVVDERVPVALAFEDGGVAVVAASGKDTDALEAAGLIFNCEHVVPQSWFAKRKPVRGDLHHVFACEPGCNSFRGKHRLLRLRRLPRGR